MFYGGVCMGVDAPWLLCPRGQTARSRRRSSWAGGRRRPGASRRRRRLVLQPVPHTVMHTESAAWGPARSSILGPAPGPRGGGGGRGAGQGRERGRGGGGGGGGGARRRALCRAFHAHAWAIHRNPPPPAAPPAAAGAGRRSRPGRRLAHAISGPPHSAHHAAAERRCRPRLGLRDADPARQRRRPWLHRPWLYSPAAPPRGGGAAAVALSRSEPFLHGALVMGGRGALNSPRRRCSGPLPSCRHLLGPLCTATSDCARVPAPPH